MLSWHKKCGNEWSDCQPITKWVWWECDKNRTLMLKYHEKWKKVNNLNWARYMIYEHQTDFVVIKLLIFQWVKAFKVLHFYFAKKGKKLKSISWTI